MPFFIGDGPTDLQVTHMGDEEELRQRNDTIAKDRIAQAQWYESLHLYAEALRIYESIKDENNVIRLKEKMADEYRIKARDFEAAGKLQEAANLFYLIDDREALERIKSRKPDVVILYDKKAGGLSQLAGNVNKPTKGNVDEIAFRSPNSPDEGEVEEEPKRPAPNGNGSKGLPVKMPKGKPSFRYCPYCGESVMTKKNPKFCPFCGEEF